MAAFPSRRGLLSCLGVVVFETIARSAAAQNTADVTAPVQQFYQALLVIMKAGRMTPFTQRFATLAPVLEKAFDLPAILRAAVGLGWSSFQQAQQQDVLTAFRRYTVATWVSNFDSYNGQQLSVLPALRRAGSAEVVQTKIAKPAGGTSVIDYVMRQAAGSWKVTDVLLDGTISQVAVLRSDFSSLLSRGPLALAASLDKKAAELMGSTAPM